MQEHDAQQSDRIAAAILENASPQRQSYESYVEAAYTQALKAYHQQLKEAVINPRSLTDETLNREFRDIAFMALNPFDSKAAADTEMRQIITYFDQKILPPLLDAFGFEEIPITIGQTQAVLSLHDIVESRPSDQPPGTVSEVLFKGFRVKGDPSGVVRKAQVIRAE